MKRFFAALILAASSLSAHAYVNCQNIEVNEISTATGPTFHKFHEVGAKGATMFISMSSEGCTDSSGNPLSSVVYLLIDDIDNAGELKKSWIAILLTAKSSGAKLSFHAIDPQSTSDGKQVLKPYHLRIK